VIDPIELERVSARQAAAKARPIHECHRIAERIDITPVVRNVLARPPAHDSSRSAARWIIQADAVAAGADDRVTENSIDRRVVGNHAALSAGLNGVALNQVVEGKPAE